MTELRNELYNQIEKLESQLIKSDNVNQYGFSTSEISNKIDELETKIAETWVS